jgi:rhodanese-related sulfurtransferase
MKTAKPQEAGEKLQGKRFIDVRTAAEYDEKHIPGSELIPLQEWSREKLSGRVGEDCVLVCKSGKRSRMAAEKLAEWGCGDAVVLEGGVDEWEACGHPVNRGVAAGVLPLERQVRIVIGLLVVVGVVLGLTVNPLWQILSGVMGAGLVFSGLTDWCGIAMIIARLPWNRGRQSGASGSPAQCRA